MRPSSKLSSASVLGVALLLAIASVAVITRLHGQANARVRAQVTLGEVGREFDALQSVPFDGIRGDARARADVQGRMRASERLIEARLAGLRRESPTSHLVLVEAPYRKSVALLEQIRVLVGRGQQSEWDKLGPAASRLQAEVGREIRGAALHYQRRAATSLRLATFGSAAMILALVSLFGVFYLRSRKAHITTGKLAQENARLLTASRQEALTDALTGLRNRRALAADLEQTLSGGRAAGESVLALFDLDGFKAYNDTFGHPAGDVLLARLAGRLAAAVEGSGFAYRVGGDEFCILAGAGDDGGERIAGLAAAALSEEGEAFRIGCSCGSVLLPAEAASAQAALGFADQRMYGRKRAGRVSASRQSTDVLLAVLAEQGTGLDEHISEIGRLAESVSRSLGLPEHEASRIRLAAELHDVGKAAIPDAILNKPGRLDADEWTFMRQHTLIGERILRAAPSLAPAAELVRSSHEWLDGTGYPDGVAGEAIPLGARVIAVCDAYHAMISTRPYSEAMSIGDALAELRRCSGTQFDPHVVRAVAALVDDRIVPGDTTGAVTRRRSGARRAAL